MKTKSFRIRISGHISIAMLVALAGAFVPAAPHALAQTTATPAANTGDACIQARQSEKKPLIIGNGIVSRLQHRILPSCYGWPTLARDDDGALLAVASLRVTHLDPFGQIVMFKSLDEGKTWGAPRILIDTPMDDRDTGIVNMGEGRLIVTTFTPSRERQRKGARGAIKEIALAYLDLVTSDMEKRYFGGLAIKSLDNGHTWSEPVKIPLYNVPHGPSLRRDGSLIGATTLMTATTFLPEGYSHKNGKQIKVFTSADGLDYKYLADVSFPDNPLLANSNANEPHIIELKNGRLVLHIRMDGTVGAEKKPVFTICQSISDDGGKTFSVPKVIGEVANQGAPPHLLQLSCGTVICTYGRRAAPFGIRAMVSRDNCETWEIDLPVWTDGVNTDLGYPSSVELPDGDILTLYYAALAKDEKPSLLWTRWRLPEQTALSLR